MNTRIVLLALASLVLAAGCASQPPYEDFYARPQIEWRPPVTLDAADAGRILGTQTHLEKTTAYLDGEIKAFQASFVDDDAAAAAGRRGVLGYMVEEYPGAQAARSYMDSTLRANRLSPADAVRIGGAELHYFTGGDVVRMVMILKANRIVRLKVNPVPARYSLAQLQRVAAELARRL